MATAVCTKMENLQRSTQLSMVVMYMEKMTLNPLSSTFKTFGYCRNTKICIKYSPEFRAVTKSAESH